jgi:hypothetical protein
MRRRRRVFAGYSVFIETLNKSEQKTRNNRGPDNMGTDTLCVGKINSPRPRYVYRTLTLLT